MNSSQNATQVVDPKMTRMIEVVKALDSNIPAEVIKTREGGGAKLSYLEGWYVIDQLNQKIGHGNWSYTSDVQLVHAGTYQDNYKKDRHTVHYIAKVRLLIKYPTGECTEYSDYGYGDGSDKVNPGKAHELAVKESVTDGLKRCAKNLGMSMGLALYDKTREYVDDAITAPVGASESASTVPVNDDAKITLQRIGALSRVLVAQKKTTIPALIALLTEKFGVETKEALSPEQATQFLAFLESLNA